MVRAAAAPSLAALVALGAAGCVRGVGTPQEPDVAKLELRGVTAVDRDELESKLATQSPVRRPGIAGVLVKDRQRLDPDALAVDRRRVEAFYRERGYYGARVTSVEVRPAGRGLVDVVMQVEEGSPVRVASVSVEGLDDAPEARARLEDLPLRIGEVFTESAYDATRDAILGALRSSGWALAEVTQSARVQPDALTAEASYVATPRRRYRFGAIRVAGAGSIPRELIREQADASIHSGEWWDESRLAQAQSRVFGLGAFGGVRVVRGVVDERGGTIDVVVAVREAPFRTLRAGPGLGLDVMRWDAHALFGWEHRNFRGGLRRVSTDLRAGYAWLPTPFTTTREGPVALIAAELQQPGALTRYVDAIVRVELERGIEQAFDFYSERLRVGLPLRIASRLSLAPSYNIEVYQLSSYGTDFVPGQEPGAGPQLENCRGSVCLLSYLEQRISWDGRDDPINTKRGVYGAISVQEGFTVGSYGYRYLRFLPEVRAFYPVRPGMVLAGRARIGALVPIGEEGEPPLVARFHAGGPLSMRGYYTRRLSKMVLRGGEWVPVGGNGLADGSVELRFDLAGALGGALFLDAGTVADASSVPSAWQTALDPTRLQWAAGIGLRYNTAFGPLRVDVASRLPTGRGEELFPSVPFTPHSEPIVAVHIALGEAF
jgi:translocation and assembly module TamA